MLLAVALYFALATLALGLWLLPGARAQAFGWTQRLVSGGVAVRRRATSDGQRHARHVAQLAGNATADGAAWFEARRGRIAVVLGVLLAAPMVPVALRGLIRLDGYDQQSSHEMNEQVAALLQGEQLVPPPPVPPEWFTARDVEQARPLIRDASRQWELLDAEFKQRLLIVFKLMHDQHGIDLVLLEGYRSPQRQAQLAALGSHVTRAGAFESYHQFGLAADVAFMRDGRIVISEQDPWAANGYARYGEVARSVGLTWGGDWQSLKDYGHVELRRAGVLGHSPSSAP